MARKRSTATRRAESEAAAARAAAIRAEQERRERRRRSLVVTAVGVVVLALVLVTGFLVQSSRDRTGEAATAPRGAVGRYALEIGTATAPATVTVVEDPMCPFCADFEKASRSWLSDYATAGKVRVRYRVISFLDDRSNGTEYSTRAASALAVVLDASGPAVAKRFHDLLFDNQPPEDSDGLSDSRLTSLAVQAGAPRAAVEEGIRTRAFEGWVANATDAGTQLEGYQGTPYVQLDGRPFTDYETVEELSANLRSAVDAAGR